MEQRAGEAVQFHVFHTVEAAVGIVESGQCRGLIEYIPAADIDHRPFASVLRAVHDPQAPFGEVVEVEHGVARQYEGVAFRVGVARRQMEQAAPRRVHVLKFPGAGGIGIQLERFHGASCRHSLLSSDAP